MASQVPTPSHSQASIPTQPPNATFNADSSAVALSPEAIPSPATPRSRVDKEAEAHARTQMLGAASFNNAQGIKYKKTELFQHFNIPERTGRRLLAAQAAGKIQRKKDGPETRGRKKKITGEQVNQMDRFLQSEWLEGNGISWVQLGEKVGIEGVSDKTIRVTMGKSMHYCKCIACQRSWVSPSAAQARVFYASDLLWKRPSSEHWRPVRFSTELQFGLGPGGKVRVIRKPGERWCGDCLQEAEAPKEKDRKRLHCWAAVGYNFKSDVHFYTSDNSEALMTQNDYISRILDPCVKPWLERGDIFILEEDGDLTHGSAENKNIVRQWKEKHGLEYYFNSAHSPDLAPIEDAWQLVKIHMEKQKSDYEDDIKKLILEAWAQIPQEWINERVDSMPLRLQQVRDSGGFLSTIQTV
jgi:hypothetical protein